MGQGRGVQPMGQGRGVQPPGQGRGLHPSASRVPSNLNPPPLPSYDTPPTGGPMTGSYGGQADCYQPSYYANPPNGYNGPPGPYRNTPSSYCKTGGPHLPAPNTFDGQMLATMLERRRMGVIEEERCREKAWRECVKKVAEK